MYVMYVRMYVCRHLVLRFCFVRRCLDACRCRVPGFGAFLLGEVRGGDPGNVTGGFFSLA